MNLSALDLSVVRLFASAVLIAVAALAVVALVSPGHRPRRNSASHDHSHPGESCPTTVFVEIGDEVQAWLPTPKLAVHPWRQGSGDHVWVRDLEGWRRELDEAVLLSVPAGDRCVSIDLTRCDAAAVRPTTPDGHSVIDDLVRSLETVAGVEVVDRRAARRAGGPAVPTGTVWFRLEANGRADDRAVAVDDDDHPLPGVHRIDVEVGERVCVASVGLVLDTVTSVGEESPPVGDTTGGVRVRLLGDIDLVGASLSPKETSLLVYLALHPGAPAEAIEEALWPDAEQSARRRLQVTASRARAAAGEEVLPPADGNRYRPGSAVTTDFAEFEALAAGSGGSDRAAGLAAALELVRGPVCSYDDDNADSYRWVDLEYWAATMEATVRQAALELAELSVDEGDYEQAAWALRQGLLAVPLDSALVEALLDALAGAGDSCGVRKEFAAYAERLGAAELGSPGETTTDVFHRAVRRCEAVTMG